MDDQSAYYTEYNPTRSSSEDSDGEDPEDEKDIDPALEGCDRGGDVDLEIGPRTELGLEQTRTRKSERSQRDPTLVWNPH